MTQWHKVSKEADNLNDDIQIIGIDHGYRNMKTANCIFQDRFSYLANEPDDLEGVLSVNGKYFTVYGDEIISTDNRVKTENQAFYYMTLAAVAKELSHRGISGNVKIRIAAGLPQKWYDAQKNDFKNFLYQKKNVAFEFEGKSYFIMIDGVSVYPQGYSAVFGAPELKKYLKNECAVVDIGGETIDIVMIENGRIVQSASKIDTHATIWLENHIQEKIESSLFEPVPISCIHNCMKMSKEESGKNKYEKLILEELKKYPHLIFTKLKEFRINYELTPIIFVGGGSGIMKRFSEENNGLSVEYITDLCINAKGFEYIEKLKMR